MRSNEVSACFTRVVVDGDRDIELAELQFVMQRIQQSLQHFPAAQRAHLGNALLNLAISRMLSETGTQCSPTSLTRLVDVVLQQDVALTNHVEKGAVETRP